MNKAIFCKIDKLSKKLRAINFLGGKCSCGESNIFKLSFHHLYDKKFKINDIKSHRWSKIETEIKKCKLLCNNCHMEEHHKSLKSRHQNNKLICLELKGTNKCIRCGYFKSKSALHFHHLYDKKFKISDLNKEIKNIENIDYHIVQEIKKCEVLCSNCHVFEHSYHAFYEKNKELILKKSLSIREISMKVDRDLVKFLFFEEKLKKSEIAKKLNVAKSTITNILKNN